MIFKIDVGKKSKKESYKLINKVRKNMGLKLLKPPKSRWWLFWNMWLTLIT